ncbi:MAG TPA: hypothetical protein VKT83_06100 [bacterium]|nr:hypothetical protein [bacterium]
MSLQDFLALAQPDEPVDPNDPKNIERTHDEPLKHLIRYYLFLRRDAEIDGGRYVDDPVGVLTSRDLGPITFSSGSSTLGSATLTNIVALTGPSASVQNVPARIFRFSALGGSLYNFTVATIAAVVKANKDAIDANQTIKDFLANQVTEALDEWHDALPAADCELGRIVMVPAEIDKTRSMTELIDLGPAALEAKVSEYWKTLKEWEKTKHPCEWDAHRVKLVVSKDRFGPQDLECPAKSFPGTQLDRAGQVYRDNNGNAIGLKTLDWYAVAQIWSDPTGAFVYGSDHAYFGTTMQNAATTLYMKICGDSDHVNKPGESADSWTSTYTITLSKSGFADKGFAMKVIMHQTTAAAEKNAQEVRIAMNKPISNAPPRSTP